MTEATKKVVAVVLADNATEARGTWYRAFWADDPDWTARDLPRTGSSTVSPVFGYASGQGGPHRTVAACAAEVRRYHPGEPVYRRGRPV